MIDAAIQSQLLQRVDQLSLEDQHRVLDFVNRLSKTPDNRSKDFLELCGTLDEQSAQEMMQAIEEGCERIDTNDW